MQHVQSYLPLILLGRHRARVMAHRPVFLRPDGGLGARIRGQVRPVFLDAIHRWPFIWRSDAPDAAALPLAGATTATRAQVAALLEEMLRGHGEGWSPAAVLEAARVPAAAEACRRIRWEAEDDLSFL